MKNVQIIEQNGRKAFAVIPYRGYQQMEKELEDYACLKALREAKADPANGPGIPFMEFAKKRGLIPVRTSPRRAKI